MTLQFIEWLRRHLDRQTFQGGCVWINKEEQTFKILWPRADRSTTEERLGVMYKWWTHKFGNTRLHNQPTAIKGNFRSCLNSKVQSGEIERVQSLNRREDSDDFKAFRFVNNSEAKRKKQERRIDRGPPSPSESSPTFGGSIYSYTVPTTDVKVEVDDDPGGCMDMKKGPTLKVLCPQPYHPNNQLVKSSTSGLFKNPNSRDVMNMNSLTARDMNSLTARELNSLTPRDMNTLTTRDLVITTSSTASHFATTKSKPQLPVEPVFRIDNQVKRLLESHGQTLAAQQQLHLERRATSLETQRRHSEPVQGLIPVVKETRSLAQDKHLLGEGCSMPQQNGLLRPGILSDYNISNILHTRKIQDILQEMLCRKPLLTMSRGQVEQAGDTKHFAGAEERKHKIESAVPVAMETVPQRPEATGSGDDENPLTSFLQYIGKELGKLPLESQEVAKNEIFRVVSEIKKQNYCMHFNNMVPDHWRLPSDKQDLQFIPK